MSCDACETARANPRSGVYRMECDECYARLLANSPGFAVSMAALKFRRDYMEALKSRFGSKWESGHRMVRAWDNVIHGAKA